MKALILAGGFATRLRPLTNDKAKPLLPIADRPIISHIVDRLPLDMPIIVSTNAAFRADFEAWRKTHPERDITIFVEPAASNDVKVGALGAVSLAIETHKINEDLLVIGGDNIFSFSIDDFLASGSGQPLLAVYDIADLEAAKRYGVVIADGRRVVSFQEKPPEPKSSLVSTCCYHFPAAFLPQLREAAKLTPDRLGSVFEYFLNQGIESHVFSFAEYWNDIGSLDAYIDAHVRLGHPSIPELLLSPELHNVFEGVNCIHPPCAMKNCRVKDSIIFGGGKFENCRIESSVIDRDCDLKNVEILHRIVEQKTVLK